MSLLRTASVLPRMAPTMTMLGRGAGMMARRGMHVENVVGHNTPFVYTNKRAFTIGYFGLIGTLFSAPFLVVKYQLFKSGH
ncbi:uncharacterized protein FOMMEDRAFT_15990 [Fomitiporia mediterranea MF3/22]|uniref:uncharacterized protein n=1 Tax=Fomitiporia mediterranea (strain MF3/22) TaxID=694068 RepID=UPI00044096EB|nr:uncharacterized protein FOMMEDRAFT_15990 [Fomitiporia mediterranea MF3/22]EJD07287.1 hypothetical protein FOMMEDRAFT_15990 [Fomitiporia mediterranea MF3/22]